MKTAYKEKNITLLPGKSEAFETARYWLCQSGHTQHSDIEQIPEEREWKKKFKELTEERASNVYLRDAFSRCIWWQSTCSQVTHGWASLNLSLVPCVYSLGQHGLLAKPVLLACPQEPWLLQIWRNNENVSFIFIFLTFLPVRKGFSQHSNQFAL